MCSPHSPDLSGFAALLAASSSAQKTITRAGATSCPCLHSSPSLMPVRPLCHLCTEVCKVRESIWAALSVSIPVINGITHRGLLSRGALLFEVQAQLPAHDNQLPRLLCHNESGNTQTRSDVAVQHGQGCVIA